MEKTAVSVDNGATLLPQPNKMMINSPTISQADIVRPTYLEINLAQLTANYHAIQQAVAPAGVMPILKANAYGHGLVEVAKHLVTLEVPYLGVAFLEDREGGLSTLETYSNRWSTALETLSSRALITYNRDHDFDETKRLVPGAPAYSPFIRHTPNAMPE